MYDSVRLRRDEFDRRYSLVTASIEGYSRFLGEEDGIHPEAKRLFWDQVANANPYTACPDQASVNFVVRRKGIQPVAKVIWTYDNGDIGFYPFRMDVPDSLRFYMKHLLDSENPIQPADGTEDKIISFEKKCAGRFYD